MVAINVFMSTLPLVYTAITAVLILISLIRVQLRLNPYKKELNNKLEIDAMVTGGATLFCGVLFVSDDNDLAVVMLLLLVVIVFINIKFLLHWAYWMSFTLAGKYKLFHTIFIMLGFALMKRSQAEKMLEDAHIIPIGVTPKEGESKHNPKKVLVTKKKTKRRLDRKVKKKMLKHHFMGLGEKKKEMEESFDMSDAFRGIDINELKKITITEEEKEESEKIQSIFDKQLSYVDIVDNTNNTNKSRIKIFAVKKGKKENRIPLKAVIENSMRDSDLDDNFMNSPYMSIPPDSKSYLEAKEHYKSTLRKVE